MEFIEQALPLARFLYCSATAAENPKDLKVMTRLGLWPEGCADEFVKKLEERYVASFDIKLKGHMNINKF